MGWTTKQLSLALMMVVTGSINTLSTKWADRTLSKGIDGTVRHFNHPFLQAVGMFLGEMSCLAVFYIIFFWKRHKGEEFDVGPQTYNPLIFLPAAICDMTGTSIMYLGLNLTFASSFQMLRGAVMIFTALLSVAFLGRVIKRFMWFGMMVVLVGLVLVGLSDTLFGGENKNDINGIISGDLLIVMAQIIAATQMVYEEKFINKHNVPALQAVGFEGLFGFLVLGTLLVPMYFIRVGHGKFSGDPEGRLENSLDAFVQLSNSWQIALATFGNIVSIAFFNFAGISITKEISATTRMVLDSCRTLVIWMFALAVGWQAFIPLAFGIQAIGFVFLIIGMCIYNNIIIVPLINKCRGITPEEKEPLLSGDDTGIQEESSNKPMYQTAQNA
ncbi:unnamed protein product [Owenia fusiformis]|uniref:EamA domain-containing protein n=1 Tax=Owenia fusiformis TaxID=6347 RepID=A0A8S4N0K3_OWEFU|nr:unnamed protein product [Owenia fusiformis]